MTPQETIDEIRKSRVIGSVTIKTEEEKPKIKWEDDSISSNTRGVLKGLNQTLMDIVVNTALTQRKERPTKQLQTPMTPYQTCLKYSLLRQQ